MTTFFLRLLTMTTLCTFVPLTALAVETSPTKGFRSFTNEISCKTAIKSLEKKEGMSDFALLVSAFITGANYVKNRDSQVDLKGMMVLTEQYCRQNPQQPVTTALIALDKAIDQRITQQTQADLAKPTTPTPK